MGVDNVPGPLEVSTFCLAIMEMLFFGVVDIGVVCAFPTFTEIGIIVDDDVFQRSLSIVFVMGSLSTR